MLYSSILIQKRQASLQISGLFACDKVVKIVWGDGTIDNAPFIGSPIHSYSSNGVYTITVFFVEYNPMGNGCFERSVQKSINVTCCECSDTKTTIDVENEKNCYINERISKIQDPTNFSGRVYHSAIWDGTEMIIWGGNIGSSYTNTGNRYDPLANTWQNITSVNAPIERSHHAVVWTGTEMLIWGGVNGPNAYLNDGGRYNPISNSWTSMSTGAGTPVVRYPGSFAYVWTGTEFIVWGGFHYPSLVPTSTGARYNPTTNTWNTIAAPTSSQIARAVWTGTEMIIFCDDDKLLRYNPNTDTWTQTTRPFCSSAAISSLLVWTGTEAIYYGKPTGGQNAVMYKYNPNSNQFITCNTLNAPNIFFMDAIFTGKHVLYFNKSYQTNRYMTFYPFNTMTNQFEQEISINIDSRAEYSVINANNDLIFWGGDIIAWPPPNQPIITGVTNEGYAIKKLYSSLSDTLSCNPNEITNLPCPTDDSPHSFTINVACDNGCKSENIMWQIKDPNNNTIKSGTNSNGFTTSLSQGEVTTNGEYTLEMEYYCGIDKCSCISKMNFEGCLTNSQDLVFETPISIYPNPTTDQISIDFKDGNASFTKAILYDLQSKEWHQMALQKGESIYQMDLDYSPNGVYILRIIGDNGIQVNRKIVKVE